MRVKMVIAAVLAQLGAAYATIRCHCLPIAMAALAIGEIIEFIVSGRLVSLMALVAAIAGTASSLYSTWKTGDRRALLKVIQDLHIRTESTEQRITQAEKERALIRLQLTQMAAEYLRQRGHLARAGKVFSLRRFTKPPEDTSALVVEDDSPTRIAMERLLSYYGFVVDTSSSPEQACGMIRVAHDRGNPYDFALLDLAFPGEAQGVDLLRSIRETSPETRAIVISGSIDPEGIEAARREGAVAVFPKPFDKGKLFELMGLHEEGGEIPG